MRLYNTFSKSIEEFQPVQDKLVRIYTCGPTVYDYDHIGHAWKYTVDDILRRSLEYLGYEVKHVRNITDVGHLTSDADTGEDKIEKKARQEGKSAWEIAEFYTRVFYSNCDKLNHLKPHVQPRATEHIVQMILLVKKLRDLGFTYLTSDGIYFDISKFSSYGQLSGNTLENLRAGARVEINDEKKSPFDFALWKFSASPASDDKGQAIPRRQMEWWFTGPFAGKKYSREDWLELDKMVEAHTLSDKDREQARLTLGFPGWHIECSAMSMTHLSGAFFQEDGQWRFDPTKFVTIDVHTGGEDNIFPHHESEIAQSESATGKRFANFWVHPRFLKIEGEKMSKSGNNFLRIEQLGERGFDPLDLRYLFLTAHYRTPLNFTWQSLGAARSARERLVELVRLWRSASGRPGELALSYREQFTDLLEDDLSVPQALALTWDLTKDPSIPDEQKLATVLDFDRVFGLRLGESEEEAVIPEEVVKLVKERDQARADKDWSAADALRDKIMELGFVVEDGQEGSVIKPA